MVGRSEDGAGGGSGWQRQTGWRAGGAMRKGEAAAVDGLVSLRPSCAMLSGLPRRDTGCRDRSWAAAATGREVRR
jgi:hypothetical protein